MLDLESKDILNLSAPAILVVWVLREVFAFLKHQSAQRKEQCETDRLAPVLQSLSDNIKKQTEILQEIHLELRENSVRLEGIDKQISQIPKH